MGWAGRDWWVCGAGGTVLSLVGRPARTRELWMAPALRRGREGLLQVPPGQMALIRLGLHPATVPTTPAKMNLVQAALAAAG